MPTPPINPPPPPLLQTPARLLISAGPTHEPIDSVRYIGNRSSGRLGIALADHAAANGWAVTLLLGPTGLTPADSRVRVHRFRTTSELQGLLEAEFGSNDVLVMAAAVADYRPRAVPGALDGKLRRGDRGLTLELDPMPDLLAAVAAGKSPHQLVVGFALEPAERLMESAMAKLNRKGLDMIVANPLETMESDMIEATILRSDGTRTQTSGKVGKADFAALLLREIRVAHAAKGGPSRAGMKS